MGLCKQCNKWISQPQGKRKKEFCDSTCRSNYWYGLNKKGKSSDGEKSEEKIQYKTPTAESYDGAKMTKIMNDEPPMWVVPKPSNYTLHVSKILKLVFPDEKTEYMEVVRADDTLSKKERDELINSLKF
jgi:hypothetical protein